MRGGFYGAAEALPFVEVGFTARLKQWRFVEIFVLSNAVTQCALSIQSGGKGDVRRGDC
jgi:hypothetical protein